jgi:hypothetical protein
VADDDTPLDQVQTSLEGIEIKLIPSGPLESPYHRIKNHTAETIVELGSHTLVLGLTIGSIWLIHLILDGLLGKDVRFFNYIPIGWIIDTAHFAAIGKFIWEIIRDFKGIKK